MTAPTHDFSARYFASLSRFMETGQERQLEEAYSLGRAAFAGDVSILDLVDIHRRASEALKPRKGSSRAKLINASFAFLAEALATFEMAQRGYWEAQARARLERDQSMMLQQSLLPAVVPEMVGFDLAVRYLPGETDSHAGGDWYDVFTLEDDQVGLVVGDVAGHGVNAAAAMGQLRIAVLAYALAGYDPAAVVEAVDALLGRLQTGEMATMVYVVAQPATGVLSVVNAGHPPPLIIDAAGRARTQPSSHGRLLGLTGSDGPRRSHELGQLDEGGYLLLYTDGLIEPMEREETDGVVRLCQVTEDFTGTADDLCDHVLAELAPNGARDDICILAATLDPRRD